ncbi:MAG: hypothetical protein HFJ49_03145 [Clostridia bacterium]|jgi:hypothetical protein|nr:hypothetical protein [Clostridia bacterium]
MKIFAIDDYKKIVNSEDYKKACMNYKFNMLENKIEKLDSVFQHIRWTDAKIKQWNKERPLENSSTQFNEWLEMKMKQYIEQHMIKVT